MGLATVGLGFSDFLYRIITDSFQWVHAWTRGMNYMLKPSVASG